MCLIKSTVLAESLHIQAYFLSWQQIPSLYLFNCESCFCLWDRKCFLPSQKFVGLAKPIKTIEKCHLSGFIPCVAGDNLTGHPLLGQAGFVIITITVKYHYGQGFKWHMGDCLSDNVAATGWSGSHCCLKLSWGCVDDRVVSTFLPFGPKWNISTTIR